MLAALLLAWLGGPLFAEDLFDRYQRWSPRKIVETRVHIVRIDAESLRRIGPWPWPRAYLAQLTNRLQAAGARAVAFDILFAEADPSDPSRFVRVFPTLSAGARAEIGALPLPDEAFGSALWELQAVVARAGVAAGGVDGNALSSADAARLRIDARFTGTAPQDLPSFPLAAANVAALEFNAHGQGLINGEPDADGVTRRVPMVARVAGRPTAGLALELVRVGTGASNIVLDSSGGVVRALGVGRYRVPVGPGGRARLHFGTLLASAETSAAAIVDPVAPLPDLRGKLVIVGPASIGLGDVRTTPLGTSEFGVRIHAQAVDALLTGGWLTRPRWALAAEWATGSALALLAVLLFPRLRGWAIGAVPLLIVLLVGVASWGAFAAAQLLLDPLRPLVIGGAAAVAVAAAAFVETGRSARQLREVAFARAGEMKAAREIQLAMLPHRTAFEGLDPRLDLDAHIEPAQQIGGDLYDAFALPDGRVVFLVGDVTGKGTPAALFMAVSKALAHSRLRRGEPSLEIIVAALNDELAINSVVEVTLLCGILDLGTGQLDLVNAGHENPWVVRAGGEVAELAMAGGLPLCTISGATYPLEHARLEPGDGLVVITDGVREAQDAHGQFFGSDRTHVVLAGWHADEAARTLTARLAATVRDFEAGAPPSDDLTVLALRWHGR